MQNVTAADNYQTVPANMGAVYRRGTYHAVDPNGNELFSHPNELVCIRWLVVGFGFDSINGGQLNKYNQSFLNTPKDGRTGGTSK